MLVLIALSCPGMILCLDWCIVNPAYGFGGPQLKFAESGGNQRIAASTFCGVFRVNLVYVPVDAAKASRSVSHVLRVWDMEL